MTCYGPEGPYTQEEVEQYRRLSLEPGICAYVPASRLLATIDALRKERDAWRQVALDKAPE